MSKFHKEPIENQSKPVIQDPTSGLSEKYKVEEKSMADRFYGESALKQNGAYGTIMQPGIEKMSDRLGLTATQAEEMRMSQTKFFYDLDIHPREAAGLHTLIAEHSVRPPSQDQINEWGAESRRILRERHGHAEADRLLSEANHYMAKREMGKTLTSTGLGNHPRVVEAIVEKVQELKRK